MSALRHLAVLGATFVGGVTGFIPVVVMGLVVPMVVVGPLTLLSTSLVAALFAVWFANFVARDGLRSRLFIVLAASGIAAVLGLLVYFATAWTVNTLDLGFQVWVTLLIYVPAALIFSETIAAVALRARAPAGKLGRDGSIMLLMAVGILLFSILTGPTFGIGFVNYWLIGGLGIAIVLASLFPALIFLRRAIPGRELMRDAAITLCLTVTLPLILYGVVYVACSSPMYCGA